MPNFIPLSIPNFEGNEKKYVNEALDAGWVSTGGAYITKLEQSMAKFLQVENVAACQSAVDAGVKRVREIEGNLYSHVVIASPHPSIYKIIERYNLEKLLPYD